MEWVGQLFINILKIRMIFFYHTVESTLEEINAKVDIIMADENLTFVGKIKEVIHQLTKDEDNNYVFMLLLEAWLVLNRQKKRVFGEFKSGNPKIKGKN